MTRLIQITLAVAALSQLGCVIRREDLSGPMADAGESEDAFSVDDTRAPIDAFTPIDSVVPADSVMPDACVPSCVSGLRDDCSGSPEVCLLGCHASARCNALRFSNVDQEEINARVDAATEVLEVSSDLEIGDCAESWMTAVSQRVCVHVYRSVDISGKVAFTGTLPVIVIARDFIHITGDVFAGARRGTPGPGGSGPADGPLRGVDGAHAGSFDDGGGGGGGSCGAGGSGGRGAGASGGPGGGGRGLSELEPLVGGSGGGSGPGDGGDAGAGGGALQLASLGEIVISGRVLVGGGAGQRGIMSGNYGAGGGGGGGGGLLIEAPTVNLGGAQLLTSGGGGGGGSGFTSSGGDGGDGASFGGGGRGSGGLSGRGGNGATESAGDTGEANGDGFGNGGGGGGGVGTIVVRRLIGIDPDVANPPASAACYSTLPARVR